MIKIDNLKDLIENLNLDEIDDNEIDEIFYTLNAFNNKIYKFVLGYYKYIYKTKDYGNGQDISMFESHIIADIANNPDISASALSKKWSKTPAYISRIINNLEEQGYIYRMPNEKNNSRYDLFLTKKGEDFDKLHKLFDIKSIVSTNRELMQYYTLDEIILCRNLLLKYLEIIENE